ncbi:MAG: MotA/TolQ/ExbB proton channel family protein [Deltaproteobacteria bacterium]|nr:MAG: MotA/TolQ/ExbB proton channel family protein [Deltaproteobacteria bacterium]
MMDFFYHMADYIRSGGVVMVPILLVSFCMWVLIFNRIMFMQRLYAKNITRKEAGELVKQNLWPEKKYKGVNSLLVREFYRHRSFDRDLDDFILDETVLRLTGSMDKYLSIITMLSAVAPLLGLLGTVVGMMGTFDVITVFGTGNARAMAGGISVALITTQTGLMVSIPGLYMSGWLRRRALNLKGRIAATGIYLKRFL